MPANGRWDLIRRLKVNEPTAKKEKSSLRTNQNAWLNRSMAEVLGFGQILHDLLVCDASRSLEGTPTHAAALRTLIRVPVTRCWDCLQMQDDKPPTDTRRFGGEGTTFGRRATINMLHWEIMAVCSEIHTKNINTVCGQNVELLNVKLAVHIVTTGL